jgi:outer membrane biosynthesis protein TonB
MTEMRRAAAFSFILHSALITVLSLHLPSVREHRALPARPIIVDFVKIGPKSAAQIHSAQLIDEKDKSQNKRDNRVTETASNKLEAIKPDSANNNQEAAKERPKITESTKKKCEVNKPATQPKPQRAKQKISDKSDKKNNEKAIAKKGSAINKQKSFGKARVDLAKKGRAVSSVGDLMGKIKLPDGARNNSAFAETYEAELTGTEIDILNKHMKRFWNIPSGHEKAYDIVVEIELSISANGNVEKAVVVDNGRLNTDPEFRIAAESALRAILDPECSPLPLSASRYEVWKHMIFVFDPHEMCR